MSAPTNELLQAIELAQAGKWDSAHEVVQQYEDDANAAWIHAVLHKIEGDLGNARYWYRRADRPVAQVGLDQEWQAIVTALIAGRG